MPTLQEQPPPPEQPHIWRHVWSALPKHNCPILPRWSHRASPALVKAQIGCASSLHAGKKKVLDLVDLVWNILGLLMVFYGLMILIFHVRIASSHVESHMHLTWAKRMNWYGNPKQPLPSISGTFGFHGNLAAQWAPLFYHLSWEAEKMDCTV